MDFKRKLSYTEHNAQRNNLTEFYDWKNIFKGSKREKTRSWMKFENPDEGTYFLNENKNLEIDQISLITRLQRISRVW